jgi:hypothetical protein
VPGQIVLYADVGGGDEGGVGGPGAADAGDQRCRGVFGVLWIRC